MSLVQPGSGGWCDRVTPRYIELPDIFMLLERRAVVLRHFLGCVTTPGFTLPIVILMPLSLRVQGRGVTGNAS